MFSFKSLVILLLVIGVSLCGPLTTSFATLINYGDFNALSVVYQQVQEDTGIDVGPLYGAPTVTPFSNAMTFNPTSFMASASGAGGVDLTDGQLATTIVALAGNRIEKIRFAEQGDYTLFGNGTANTAVSVGAALFLRVESVEGGGPFTPVSFNANLIFSPSAGTYNLVDDGGIAKIWNGGVEFDLTAALLAQGITEKATKVYMTVDNTLAAMSENGTVAFIKKKEVGGFSVTTIVPEPSTLALLGMSIIGLSAFAWKKRKQ